MKNENESPLGLGIALAQNREAFRSFASLSIPEQQDFIENAHTVTSPDEMRAYVGTLIRTKDGERFE